MTSADRSSPQALPGGLQRREPAPAAQKSTPAALSPLITVVGGARRASLPATVPCAAVGRAAPPGPGRADDTRRGRLTPFRTPSSGPRFWRLRRESLPRRPRRTQRWRGTGRWRLLAGDPPRLRLVAHSPGSCRRAPCGAVAPGSPPPRRTSPRFSTAARPVSPPLRSELWSCAPGFASGPASDYNFAYEPYDHRSSSQGACGLAGTGRGEDRRSPGQDCARPAREGQGREPPEFVHAGGRLGPGPAAPVLPEGVRAFVRGIADTRFLVAFANRNDRHQTHRR